MEIERKRTQIALETSESRFQQTADSIPETIRVIIDSTPALIHTALPDGYIDFFNQTWLRYLGLPSKRYKAETGPARFIRRMSKAPDLTLYDIALWNMKLTPL